MSTENEFPTESELIAHLRRYSLGTLVSAVWGFTRGQFSRGGTLSRVVPEKPWPLWYWTSASLLERAMMASSPQGRNGISESELLNLLDGIYRYNISGRVHTRVVSIDDHLYDPLGSFLARTAGSQFPFQHETKLGFYRVVPMYREAVRRAERVAEARGEKIPQISVQDVLERLTGATSPVQFAASCLMLFCAATERDHPVVPRSWFHNGVGIQTPHCFDRVIDFLGGGPDDFRDYYQDQKSVRIPSAYGEKVRIKNVGQNWSMYFMNGLFRYPVLRPMKGWVEGGQEPISIPFPSLLCNQILPILYFELARNCHGDFNQWFGAVFEQYCGMVIEDMCALSTRPLRLFSGDELRARGYNAKSRKQVPDWFIVDDDFLLIVECKSGARLRRGARIVGDEDDIAKSIEPINDGLNQCEIFLRNLRQSDDKFEAFSSVRRVGFTVVSPENFDWLRFRYHALYSPIPMLASKAIEYMGYRLASVESIEAFAALVSKGVLLENAWTELGYSENKRDMGAIGKAFDMLYGEGVQYRNLYPSKFGQEVESHICL